MERENPTREELERRREEFERLVDECRESDRCPCRAADDWVMEHSISDEWGCPGWCWVLAGIEADLRGDAASPDLPDGVYPEEIPF